MLLEFRIRNFRSIKGEQTLSLVAAPADKQRAQTHLAPTRLQALPLAVRSAVPRKGLRGQLTFQPGGDAQGLQQEGEFLCPLVERRSERGGAMFELHEQFEGTQRLFCLAAPVFDALRHGRVLIVGDLDRKLHTLLVRRLVGMFHDPVRVRGRADAVGHWGPRGKLWRQTGPGVMAGHVVFARLRAFILAR